MFEVIFDAENSSEFEIGEREIGKFSTLVGPRRPSGRAESESRSDTYAVKLCDVFFDTSRRTPPRFAFNRTRTRRSGSNRVGVRVPPTAEYEYEKTGIAIEEVSK